MAGRFVSFRFTMVPTPVQEEALRRHAGASRFGYNQALALHIAAKRQAREGVSVSVPYSGFDFINAFNAWKRSLVAGGTPEQPGLPWRAEVFQGVFEEACVDLGRALEARADWFKGERKGACPGKASFKKRATSRASFRIRNKAGVTGTTGATVRFRPLRQEDAGIPCRAVRLPHKVGGVIRLREDTRRLRRLLAKPETVLRFVTISRDLDRWTISVTLETGPLHEAHRFSPEEVANAPAVGIDRGLATFAVLATAEGVELERVTHPRPLRAQLPRLRRASRAHARKVKGSANRRRAQRRLQRVHRRIRNVREDFVRRVTSRLAKTHGRLVLETLCTKGLMRTRLARSIADSAWARFATRLARRVQWHGGEVLYAARTYPSTRRCSACGVVGDALPLSQRQFHCARCGFEADRDTNAAINLAKLAETTPLHAAEKPSEAQNACGGGSAGAGRSRPSSVELPS